MIQVNEQSPIQNDISYIYNQMMCEIWYMLQSGIIPKYSKESSQVGDSNRTGTSMSPSGNCGPGGCPSTTIVPPPYGPHPPYGPQPPHPPYGPHGPGQSYIPDGSYIPGQGLYVFLCHGVAPTTSQEFCYYSVAYEYIPNSLYTHCERVAGPFRSMRDCDIWIESKGVRRGQYFNCQGLPSGLGGELFVYLCRTHIPSNVQQYCYYSVAYETPNSLNAHCERVAGPFVSMEYCDKWIQSKGVRRGQFFLC